MHKLVTLAVIFATFSFNAWASNKAQGPLFTVPVTYQGDLGYLDYRSNKPVSIPMEMRFLPSADGRQVVVDMIYTDPGKKIYSLSVLDFDLANKTVRETAFNQGKSSSQTFAIVDLQYTDATHWSISRTTRRMDDNRAALITVKERLNDDIYHSETRVDYLDTPDNDDLRRNWVALKLKPDNPK